MTVIQWQTCQRRMPATLKAVIFRIEFDLFKGFLNVVNEEKSTILGVILLVNCSKLLCHIR